MSARRDSMVFRPGVEPGPDRPQRRAQNQRKKARAAAARKSILRRLAKVQKLRALQSAVSLKNAARARKAAGAGAKAAGRLGLKAGARIAGPVGVALLVMDAVNAVGNVARRSQEGISGRLLAAMNANTVYGELDEQAAGIANARSRIEGNEVLLGIIGRQGRVNGQIAELFASFKERETARAIGSDLIEREPTADHLGSLTDKFIKGATSAVKTSADAGINAIRDFFGKEPLVR